MNRMKAVAVLLVLGSPLLVARTEAQPPLPSTVLATQSPATRAADAGDIGYLTAAQLSRRCTLADPASSSYCFAYIAAVTDTARAYEVWLNAKEFCLPLRISQSETRRAFLTYVSAYPKQALGQAASVVVNALKQTYPCD